MIERVACLLRQSEKLHLVEEIFSLFAVRESLKGIYSQLLFGVELTEETETFIEKIECLANSEEVKGVLTAPEIVRPHYEPAIVNGEESLILYNTERRELEIE
jgi:hypothetical protein